ncbi:MAG TPA: Eco29kI family restriction endonuclease [Verrucomicrobiales bacterium]|nr:Eco29kI family restriction endonuclease [Verrucomicrobiae bacterium]HRX54582.1 Eco29kI family restriction endonuclease [Verrucomicrobiales bacterium]
MPKNHKFDSDIDEILKQIGTLRRSLGGIFRENDSAPKITTFVEQSGKLIAELQLARETVSPIRFGPIGITLGRSDSIAKFFAFSFVNTPKKKLGELSLFPFFGSGVYALYYHGKSERAYQPLCATETPIYVGKADPKDSHAETVENQGPAIFKRLMEHAKNIGKTTLDLEDFSYRSAAIQTGMQSSVEEFMIRLFRPIWNKEVKICFGIGKHGDSSKTRANKRSPWDTMHPGRHWAASSSKNQMERGEIEARIADHFKENPTIKNKDDLYQMLSLE